MVSSLLKYVSDFTAGVFSSEKELLTKKDTTKNKNINISSLNKILKIRDNIFELIQMEVQCSKSHFKIFLSQEAGASGNNIEKEMQKPRPKLKKHIY